MLVPLVNHISLCHPTAMMLSHFCYFYSILSTILSRHVYLIYVYVKLANSLYHYGFMKNTEYSNHKTYNLTHQHIHANIVNIIINYK
jgi:hypothetical protein